MAQTATPGLLQASFPHLCDRGGPGSPVELLRQEQRERVWGHLWVTELKTLRQCPAPSCCDFLSHPAFPQPSTEPLPAQAFHCTPQETRTLPWTPSLPVHFYLFGKVGAWEPQVLGENVQVSPKQNSLPMRVHISVGKTDTFSKCCRHFFLTRTDRFLCSFVKCVMWKCHG